MSFTRSAPLGYRIVSRIVFSTAKYSFISSKGSSRRCAVCGNNRLLPYIPQILTMHRVRPDDRLYEPPPFVSWFAHFTSVLAALNALYGIFDCQAHLFMPPTKRLALPCSRIRGRSKRGSALLWSWCSRSRGFRSLECPPYSVPAEHQEL